MSMSFSTYNWPTPSSNLGISSDPAGPRRSSCASTDSHVLQAKWANSSSRYNQSDHQLDYQNEGAHRRKEETNVEKDGVKQSVYATWIKKELESESACLELPFTIILLVSFSLVALAHLGQSTILKVEDAIVNDITENTNFAFAHAFGHKGIDDVNSFADFWSWSRIGLFAILPTPGSWSYSEDLSDAVSPPSGSGVPAYDADALPSHIQLGGDYRTQVPGRNSYLRYHRLIGGFRFRQQVAPADRSCFTVGSRDTFEAWRGKKCSGVPEDELPPDNYVAESMPDPARAEWFLSETETRETMLQHLVDMEDGCTSARAQNRTCLCNWCGDDSNPQPWLNESTQRIEISFIVYNPQYGLYSMGLINFWFTRAGIIYKLATVRSAWVGILTRPLSAKITMGICDFVWLASILYVCKSEGSEIRELVKAHPEKKWYKTLLDDYIGFWNFVDWTSICVAFLIMFCFATMYVATLLVNWEFGDFVSADFGALSHAERLSMVESFYSSAELMFAAERNFRFWLSIYPLIIMLRLFKSFAAQPRLAIVTETFTVAKNDLMHFFIVFFSTYFCFSVNAVLFFGQDSVNFSTLYRALHSSFRIMLGDWDWDELDDIGQLRAFVWFSTFMLVMVLILMNMLLAILMDSYAVAKESASQATSLPRQVKEMVRRHREFKKGLRVRLNDIWDALYEKENKDEKSLLTNEQLLYPENLQNLVPTIPRLQAHRTLLNAITKHKEQNDPAFTPGDLEEPLARTLIRVENSARCAAWLSTKYAEYKEAEESRGSSGNNNNHLLQELNQRSSHETKKDQEELIREGIEAVRLIAQERTRALSDGVGSVLAEEMQCLERRQREQHAAMEQMQSGLNALRQLVYKLNQTCMDIADLSAAANRDGNQQVTRSTIHHVASEALALTDTGAADAPNGAAAGAYERTEN